MDFEQAKRERDRRLRRALLSALHFAQKMNPSGFSGGMFLMDAAGPGSDGFEGPTHALELLRQLVSKGLAEERLKVRRRGELFGLQHCEYRITAKGDSLWLETIPPDPDIDDDRVVE